MEEDRAPKLCLRDEARAAINEKSTKWEKSVRNVLVEGRDGQVVKMIWEKREKGEIGPVLERALKIKLEQELQGHWGKIDISAYHESYKEIKKMVVAESYWEEWGTAGWMKEQCARLRCRNLGKISSKGYSDTACRVNSMQTAGRHTGAHNELRCSKGRDRR